jgi:mercuric ion transport protein
VSSSTSPRSRSPGTLLGWSAIGAAALAVFAWSACCVLPIGLSLIGLSLAGMALLAEQRTWLTFGAVIILAAAWRSMWRRRNLCVTDASCAPPSRHSMALLSTATALSVLALAWRPLIEPWALSLMRTLR